MSCRDLSWAGCDRLGPQGIHGPCHLPPAPWVGQGRSWFLLGSLAGAGLSLKLPMRQSPGRGTVNPGTLEVPLPPALLTQLVAEPSPGLSPFPQSSLCPHPWEGQLAMDIPGKESPKRPLPRSLKWQGWDSSPGLVVFPRLTMPTPPWSRSS